MKIWMKSVDMICLSSCEGEIRPLKFRIWKMAAAHR